MASVIYRPCYATREEVKRALDVKQAAYSDNKIDRAIQSSSEGIDGLTARKFYPMDETRYKDWPNFDYSFPWRMWLDQDEFADIVINPPVINSGGVIIPNANILFGDPKKPNTPPFTQFQLRRDQNSVFGNGPTPQREVAMTATFGYWMVTIPTGTFTASVASTDNTVLVSEGDAPGVGDVIIVGSLAGAERMIVTDSNFANTSIPFSGVSTASAADNMIAVPDGTKFTKNETIQIDTEWMLIQSIFGNNLIVKRGWDGSILQTHTGGNIWARRLLTVLRGQLGTTAAAYTSPPTSINTLAVPGLVKQLCIAESLVTSTDESSAYAAYGATGSTGQGSTLRSTGTISFGTTVREPLPGPGIPDLRARVLTRYGRQARSRVI